MTADTSTHPATTGLILSGGGARAAYQVGVLSAIADLLPDSSANPFPVIVGTSAGAINAVSLACGALHFHEAVRRLCAVWRSFHTDQVYRSDWPGVLRQASRFLGHNVFGIGKQVPVALLDSSPLAELLERAGFFRHCRCHAPSATARCRRDGIRVRVSNASTRWASWCPSNTASAPTASRLSRCW